MSSDSSAVESALADYVAGRLAADALAPIVAAAFFDARGAERREALRPVLEVVERAAPGMVSLARADGVPGFALAAAGRSVAPAYEAELRRAAAAALEVLPPPGRSGGVLDRLWGAVQRWFAR